MKTLLTKLTLAVVTAAFLTLPAFAGDRELVRVDHGRGTTYILRPVENEATIALFGHGQGIGRTVEKTRLGTVKEHEMGRGTRHFFYVPAK